MGSPNNHTITIKKPYRRKKTFFRVNNFSLFLLALSIDGVFLFAKFTSPIMSDMELSLGYLVS